MRELEPGERKEGTDRRGQEVSKVRPISFLLRAPVPVGFARINFWFVGIRSSSKIGDMRAGNDKAASCQQSVNQC